MPWRGHGFSLIIKNIKYNRIFRIVLRYDDARLRRGVGGGSIEKW